MSTRPPRRSLAGAFRPTSGPGEDRAVALVGLLPPREPTRPQPPLGQDEPQEGGSNANIRSAGSLADQERPSAEQVDGGAKPQSGGGAGTPADKVRNVAIYLPLELLRKLRETARSRELTYADLLVEAASAHLDSVASRLTPPSPTTPPGGGMPSRATRRAPAPGVQVQFRLDGHQVAWLDEQAASLGAPSRTALVSALLRAHLGVACSSQP
jgi:hypothetical protein